jgi:hypothetical protein
VPNGPEFLRAALALAAATAEDGRQRALDYSTAELEALQQLRLTVRKALCAALASSPLRRVLPLAVEQLDQYRACPDRRR